MMVRRRRKVKRWRERWREKGDMERWRRGKWRHGEEEEEKVR